MSLSSEAEAFVKELADRAKAQNRFPRVASPEPASPAYSIQTLIHTQAGKVSMSPEEKRRLEAVCEREGKTGTQLINEYL
jgi:hypothetical protein